MRKKSRTGHDFGFDTKSGAKSTARSARREASYGEALPQKSTRRGAGSRLLPDESPVESIESFQPGKFVVFGKFMLIPLFFAVSFKVWYLIEMGDDALKSMPFLGDQVSQLVVIVCLMIFTYLATSEF